MNIWRKCIAQNQTPGPTPTPIPPWDYNSLIFEKYPNVSRKVVNNEDVSANNIEKYFADNAPLAPSNYKRSFVAYNSSGQAINVYCSGCGVSRLYNYKPNIGGEFNYNEDYDNNSTQYTTGKQIAYYCIYWITNTALSLPYFALTEVLAKNGFYRNIPDNMPIQPPVEMPVVYFKNGIYRVTKELVTPGTPIPTENTLAAGYKIGNTTTLYDLVGTITKDANSDRAYIQIPISNTAGRPWSHTSLNNEYISECGGTTENVAYVIRNGIRYNPNYFYGLSIPFIPIKTVGYSYYNIAGVTYYVRGIVIASSNFALREQSVERV